MNTMILVLAAIIVSAAMLAFVAFHRGWFRLAPLPSETRGQFVLMLKKDKARDDEKKALQFSKDMGRQPEENVAPPTHKI